MDLDGDLLKYVSFPRLISDKRQISSNSSFAFRLETIQIENLGKRELVIKAVRTFKNPASDKGGDQSPFSL